MQCLLFSVLQVDVSRCLKLILYNISKWGDANKTKDFVIEKFYIMILHTFTWVNECLEIETSRWSVLTANLRRNTRKLQWPLSMKSHNSFQIPAITQLNGIQYRRTRLVKYHEYNEYSMAANCFIFEWLMWSIHILNFIFSR